MNWIEAACITLVFALAAAPVRPQEPKTSTRETVATGRVERVDISTRSLTLRANDGVVHTVYVEPGLKVFGELKSGDRVIVRIAESVVVALRPNAKPSGVVDSTADAKKQPEYADGSREVRQQLKATVTIESIDLQQAIVTYKTGDNRRVTRAVADAHLLDGLHPGDIIEITYTRERALEIERGR